PALPRRQRRGRRPRRHRAPPLPRLERGPAGRRALAGVGPVQVPVAAHLGVPAVVARRQDGEAADRALATLLVTVEKVDRERPALDQKALQLGTQGIVAVADGAFPVPGAA